MNVPGAARPATSADRSLLVSWLRQFGIDAGLPMHDVEGTVESRLGQGTLRLWVCAGEPVALAGLTVVGTVGRVGPVYTPAELRGRGYGSAVTAAVTGELLSRCETVMLFTDAANPTSNSIYAALGYRVVAEVVEAELPPASG